MRLRDLDADREPEVIVDLFTGGAHCCAVSTIYTFEEGTGKYARAAPATGGRGLPHQDWGATARGAAQPRRTLRLRFSSLRGVVPAVQVLPPRRGAPEGRDAELPALAARGRHARRYGSTSSACASRDVNVRGILAAYAADRYRLGRAQAPPADAAPRGGRARRRGRRPYVKRVDRFLKRIGYTEAPEARMAKKGKRKAARATWPPTARRATATTCSRGSSAGSSSRARRSSRCATAAVQLKDAYAEVRDGEVWLRNMHVAPYKPAAQREPRPGAPAQAAAPPPRDRAPDRARPPRSGLTIVPTRVYFSGRHAKVEIAVARGKDVHDKRRSIKDRDQRREIDRALSERL